MLDVSALRYWSFPVEEDEESVVDEEESVLDEIFETCYDDLIEACKCGKVSDDNAVIGAILSLMERVIPKLLDAYKDNPTEYESRVLACATALRVTIAQCMPFDKFMTIMNDPNMLKIDSIVEEIAEKGRTEAKVDELANVFKNMKGLERKRPDIYG